MGLFSSIGKAIGSVVGGITGATSASKSAKKAADLQYQAAQQGIDEQRRQFDLSRADSMPWLEAGTGALGGIQDLLGLSGGPQQAAAISALRDSPLFNSLYNAGEEAILANASATGGLRGGNIQRSLADFGSDTLSNVIRQQLADLGGLSGVGVGTAQNLGALGSNASANIAGLLQQGGAAQAGGILAQGARDRTAFGDLIGIGSAILGAGGFGGGGGGGIGAGGMGPITITPMNKRF